MGIQKEVQETPCVSYKGLACKVVSITRRYRFNNQWVISVIVIDELGKRHSTTISFNRLWDFLMFNKNTRVNVTNKE